MRTRAGADHAEALARRLEQLRAELDANTARSEASGGVADHRDQIAGKSLAPPPQSSGAQERGPASPSSLALTPYDEGWDDYTRIRPAVPAESPPPLQSPQPQPPPESEGPSEHVETLTTETSGSPVPPIPAPGRHAARRHRAWIDLSGLRGRVSLEPVHVALVAVLAAVALGITCWWVLADDAGEPLPPTTAPEGLVTPAAEGDAAGQPSEGAPAATTEVVVDVAGKVRTPGIVVLDSGSRVVDAVDAAGGAKRGADLTGLNLARVLVDGEQIVVGEPAPPGLAASAAPSGAPASPGGLVNLNTAGLTELDELPGVGPVTAQAIIDWRDANAGFRSVDQLLEVQGIGEKTLADLAPLVTL